jgi:hypothetical protein
MNWKEQFPQFEPGLIELIEKEAVQRSFNAGDIIMHRTIYQIHGAGAGRTYKNLPRKPDGGEF